MYTVERSHEAVLTSTHRLCFRAKIRKIGIPLYTPVFESGLSGGIIISQICYPDGVCPIAELSGTQFAQMVAC